MPPDRYSEVPRHGRFAYSAIHQRPDYRWPNGARLAVYLGFNVEHFAFGEGLGASLGPVSPQPDVLNYSWREYGNRVGVWRCLELFDTLKLPTGALINTALYAHCPEVIAACVAREKGSWSQFLSVYPHQNIMLCKLKFCCTFLACLRCHHENLPDQ